jgi:lipopolysaccharide export LptBFGC system permease protein LptF
VRNLVEAREWAPPLMPGGGVLLSPDRTRSRSRNEARGVSVGVSLCFFLLYWACLLGGEELADRDLFDPVWAMWAANIVIGVPGVFLVWFTGRDRL